MIKPHNDGKKIDDAIGRVACTKHSREVGEACWSIYPDSKDMPRTRAVCGSRIRAAGFVGQISETAVQTKRKAAYEMKKEVRA